MTDTYYTKNSGEIVTLAYVRRRVVQRCGAETARYTVDNPEWMKGKNGMLAAAIVRDAWAAVLLDDGTVV